MNKPLGIKAYGSIPHIPGSKLGSGDHYIHPGQARIAMGGVRDKHDKVFIEEKLDGSCCAVALVEDELIPLVRAGYRAETSPYIQHKVFARWVHKNREKFLCVLNDGDRIVGEWLMQAHGTRYHLVHEPWVAFDIFVDGKRLTLKERTHRINRLFVEPNILYGAGNWVGIAQGTIDESNPAYFGLQLKHALAQYNPHGRLGSPEGVIFRVERQGKVDFLCKWVNSDYVPGKYLPGLTESIYSSEVWNDNIQEWLPFWEVHNVGATNWT